MKHVLDPEDSSANGFVLAEAVVAITIAAIALGGAITALRQGVRLHQESLKRSQALVLCESYLRGELARTSGSLTQIPQSGPTALLEFSYRLKVEALNTPPLVEGKAGQIGSPQSGWEIKKIKSEIFWKDGRRVRSVALSAVGLQKSDVR